MLTTILQIDIMFIGLDINNQSKRGYTLVEIMIVVVIVGLLAALAIPAFEKVSREALAKRIANDYRIFAGAFEVHSLEQGVWPEDGIGNALPASAQPYIRSSMWADAPAANAYWDWEGQGRHGMTASINLVDPDSNLDVRVMEIVDRTIDNDDLSSGLLRRVNGNEYIYILEF